MRWKVYNSATNQGLINSFCQVPYSKYFRFCRTKHSGSWWSQWVNRHGIHKQTGTTVFQNNFMKRRKRSGQDLSHDPQFENPSMYLVSVSSSFPWFLFSESWVLIQIMKEAVPAMVYFLSIYCVPNTLSTDMNNRANMILFLPSRILDDNRKWLIFSAAKCLDNIYFIMWRK